MFISHRAMMGGGASRVEVTVTITGHVGNYTLQPSAVPGYESGNTDITFIINSGIIIYSTSTGSTALTISGFAAGDSVSVTNNGYIVGKGGNGGSGKDESYQMYGNISPQAGGRALSTNFAVSMTNNGTIGGGGGGGSGSAAHSYYLKGTYWHAGNGGGGGAGSSGSSGGAYGQKSIGMANYTGSTGSGGGLTGGGSGGSCSHGNAGGTGGALGASGGSGYVGGGAGGACTSGNSYITWVTTGTRAGALN